MFAIGNLPKIALDAMLEMSGFCKVPLQLAADGSNSQLFYAAVSPAEQKSFCRNDAGWLRNDIDLFMDLDNQKVASEVLSRLEEIPSKGFPSDENPDVIRMSLMSKYQQTESEVTRWIEQQLEFQEFESKRKELEQNEKLSSEERERMLKEFRETLSSEDRDIWLKERRRREIERMIDEEEVSKRSK